MRILAIDSWNWGEPCPHDSWTGDEGPVALLGRMPVRWRCDGCGQIRTDAAPSADRTTTEEE